MRHLKLQARKRCLEIMNIFTSIILNCSQNGQIPRKIQFTKLIKEEIENLNNPVGIDKLN
jgi:hypothetical protein